jgi:hypothetical protein
MVSIESADVRMQRQNEYQRAGKTTKPVDKGDREQNLGRQAAGATGRSSASARNVRPD